MAFAPLRRVIPARVRFKNAPLAPVLLTIDSLPNGNWQVRSERAIRTGATETQTDATQRCEDAGLVAVGRTFRDRESRRGLWVQLSPWATAEDAQDRFDAGEDELHAKLTAGAVTFSAEEVAAPSVSGADAVRAVEYLLPTRKKQTTMLMLVWRRGACLCTVGADATQQPWSWDQVAHLAEVQTGRLSAHAAGG